MNIEKIEINKHYVWVDKDAEIKEGDYYYVDNSLGKRIENILPYPSGFVAKIIAASPELNLEGVPNYIEWLAVKEYPITKGGSMQMPSSFDLDQSNRQSGFIKGYQTAKNELPTWDDVRKAIELAWLKYEPQEIIEQLKQSKK